MHPKGRSVVPCEQEQYLLTAGSTTTYCYESLGTTEQCKYTTIVITLESGVVFAFTVMYLYYALQ